MKRLFLCSLLSCLLVGQISAGYLAVIGGGLFTAGSGVLGSYLGKRAMPERPYTGALSGGFLGLAASGLITWALSKCLPTANATVNDAEQNAPSNDQSHSDWYRLVLEDVRKGQSLAACLGVIEMLRRTGVEEDKLAQGYTHFVYDLDVQR